MARPLRILVIGAGVGGISVARGLLRDGHHVTVFERRPDARAGRRSRHHLVQRLRRFCSSWALTWTGRVSGCPACVS